MKKKLIFAISLIFLINVNTKAQKSGILQKDHYGAFTGNDWEDFLAGRRAAEFEKKSNVKLDDYLKNMVTPFIKDELKETTIASSVANSIVVTFPEGSDVYTSTTDGKWITRKAYPGEKGFQHTPTGINWLSFSCGNLTLFKPNGTGDMMTYNKPNPPATPPANNSGGNTNTITLNPGSNQGREMSASEFYMSYSMGRNDRQTDFLVDASIFKDIQNSKERCQTGVASGQSMFAVMPVGYGGGGVSNNNNNSGGSQGSDDQNLNVRIKPNATDIINTGANMAQALFHGIETFRGYRIEGVRSSYGNYSNYGNYGYSSGTYNNGTGGPVDPPFSTTNSGGYFDNSGNSGSRGNGFGTRLGNGR